MTTQPPALKRLTADDFRESKQRGCGFALMSQGVKYMADFDALRDLGAGHARIWLHAVERASGYAIPRAQMSALRETLDALAARGIYAVLVLSVEEGRIGKLWHSELLMQSVVLLWARLARRLRYRNVIAGFDILNEPVPDGRDYAERQDVWLTFADRVVRAIRAHDPRRVVIVESAPNAIPQSFDAMRGLPFSNIVYSPHSYMPMEYTHQGVMSEHPDAAEYTAEHRARLEESLRAVDDFDHKTGLPIYVGEFSAIKWAAGATEYVRDSIAMFEARGWSWAYHEFRGWEGWDAEVSGSDYIRSDDAPTASVLRVALVNSLAT